MHRNVNESMKSLVALTLALFPLSERLHAQEISSREGAADPFQPILGRPEPADAEEPVLRFADAAEMNAVCVQAMSDGQQAPMIGIDGREVTTLFQRYNQVNLAEWSNECVPERSDLYLIALGRGWIEELTEPDGYTSYQYAVCNPALAPVLNDDGLVVVGDVLYQYTPDSIKECAYSGPASITALKGCVASANGITVTPVVASPTAMPSGFLASGYNWSKTGVQRYWDNNKKRVTISVKGTSSNSGTSLQSVTYNVNVKVERKALIGKKWVLGNFTCCYLYSSWYWTFGLATNATPFHCTSFYSTNLSMFPVQNTYPTTYWPSINDLWVNLLPNGLWTCSSSGYDYFCDAIRVYQYAFSGSICGGSYGIQLNPLTGP